MQLYLEYIEVRSCFNEWFYCTGLSQCILAQSLECSSRLEQHCAVIVHDKLEQLSEMPPWVKSFVPLALACQQRSVSVRSSQRMDKGMWGLCLKNRAAHIHQCNAVTTGEQAVRVCLDIRTRIQKCTNVETYTLNVPGLKLYAYNLIFSWVGRCLEEQTRIKLMQLKLYKTIRGCLKGDHKYSHCDPSLLLVQRLQPRFKMDRMFLTMEMSLKHSVHFKS